MSEETRRRRVLPRRLWLIAAVTAVLAAGAVAVAVWHRPPPRVALPLRPAGEIPLPGDSSRFDYASLDPDRGLLFVAHLGANEIVEIDVHAGSVVRVIPASIKSTVLRWYRNGTACTPPPPAPTTSSSSTRTARRRVAARSG